MFKHFKLHKELTEAQIKSTEPIEYASIYINTDNIVEIDYDSGNGRHPICVVSLEHDSHDVIGTARQLASEINEGIWKYIEPTEFYIKSLKDDTLLYKE